VLDFDDRPDLARPNGVWNLGTADAAELAKLAETTYRDINIAFANELARVAEAKGIDVDAVIDASNSQPFSHIHRAGIAVGGHCIPVYPYFLLAGAPDASLPAAARAVNEAVPARAVARLAELAGGFDGGEVAILGLAYRGGVKEHAFSGAYAVAAAVEAEGGVPVLHDPLYTAAEVEALGFEPYELGRPVVAAVVQTDHAAYRGLGPADLPGARAVADGRRALDPDRWAGTPLWVIGDGTAGP
jgi:nucleotide sugar dehydrogenase